MTDGIDRSVTAAETLSFKMQYIYTAAGLGFRSLPVDRISLYLVSYKTLRKTLLEQGIRDYARCVRFLHTYLFLSLSIY